MAPYFTAANYLKILLILNSTLLIAHILRWQEDIYYFFQLTIIGQFLVVSNFYLSLTLHEQKSNLHIRLLLSRLHLVTISMEAVIVVGFWGLRVFFVQGILPDGERSIAEQAMSIYLHGGSFLTMLYFIRTNQIMPETMKRKKYAIHLLWAVPFAIIQILHFHLAGKHLYRFMEFFTWTQIFVFETALYLFAIGCDYFFSIKQGFDTLQRHTRKEAQMQKQK